MPLFDLEFEVYCRRCGNGLCDQSYAEGTHGKHRYPYIKVEPCVPCMESENESAKDEGRREGYKEGFEDGVLEASENE